MEMEEQARGPWGGVFWSSGSAALKALSPIKPSPPGGTRSRWMSEEGKEQQPVNTDETSCQGGVGWGKSQPAQKAHWEGHWRKQHCRCHFRMGMDSWMRISVSIVGETEEGSVCTPQVGGPQRSFPALAIADRLTAYHCLQTSNPTQYPNVCVRMLNPGLEWVFLIFTILAMVKVLGMDIASGWLIELCHHIKVVWKCSCYSW